MDFFHSLSLDLKLLVVGIAGCALLALFSGNRRTEKRYMLVLVLLAVAGVYRFTHGGAPEPELAASTPAPHFVKAAPVHRPLVSTSAK
jgi:hypothetical protein